MSAKSDNELTGLTVLSLEQAMTLPFLTMKLAMEGMHVIRVENPERADPNRYVGAEVIPLKDKSAGQSEEGMNAYYLPNNLGKKGITLNLAVPEGRQLLRRLVSELPVDIFATNQRPRSYEKLGIDYAQLKQAKADLIWVGITGFGLEHDEAAYDPILQARAGFMELTGERNGNPMVFGLPMVDLGAAEHAYGQVMKALYHRARTGEGGRVDISMFQSAVSWMVSPILMAESFGVNVTRRGNTHPFFAPVSVYPTKDGHIYIAIGSDRQWTALTQMPGFESLARDEWSSNAGRIEQVDDLNHVFSRLTRKKSSAELIDEFTSLGLPISKVNQVQDVYRDTLIANYIVKARDPYTEVQICIPPPPIISAYLQRRDLTMGFPPRLGEHNEDVYGSLGCDLAALQSNGVI